MSADVGGTTAGYIDLANQIAKKLPLVIGVVLALSFVLLLLAFRSVLVSLKAVLMNLLSIGAAFGIVTYAFGHHWSASLVGLDGTVPIVSFVPLMMFAILFGLSMDYEVFLMTHVRERWLATDDAHQAVIDGLAGTARVITSAALIMVSVFCAFLLNGDPNIKQFGLGMAAAVAVDATVVRCLLVPAIMSLLGRAGWWCPGGSTAVSRTSASRARSTSPSARRQPPAPRRPRRWPYEDAEGVHRGCRPGLARRNAPRTRQLGRRAGGAGARPPHPERLDQRRLLGVRRLGDDLGRRLWSDSTGFYGTADIRTSAAMLAAHSIAAQVGYTGGPTRNDARAKRMAEQLVTHPPFRTAPSSGSTGSTNPHSSSQSHTPGWTSSPTSSKQSQHVSIDPKVAEALSRAWLVRDTIGLSAQTASLIASRVQATAEGVFFKYPNMRLNQVNWYLELYVWAAVTTDAP